MEKLTAIEVRITSFVDNDRVEYPLPQGWIIWNNPIGAGLDEKPIVYGFALELCLVRLTEIKLQTLWFTSYVQAQDALVELLKIFLDKSDLTEIEINLIISQVINLALSGVTLYPPEKRLVQQTPNLMYE